MPDEKPIHWIGSSHSDLVEFPERARKAAGYDLGRVQNSLMPLDWKPMESVGQGTQEIRITTADGGASIQHRVPYVARFAEAVYVLHASEKTSQRTSRHDLEVGRARYKQMLQIRREAEKQRNRE